MVKGELKSLRITLEATDAGILGYVYLQDSMPDGVDRTIEVEPNVMADYDDSGMLVGVEFLDAGAARAELMHRLAEKLHAPELAGLDLSQMCGTPATG